MVEVQFKWVNGRLTPLKDAPAAGLETLGEVKEEAVLQRLNTENLAKLGTTTPKASRSPKQLGHSNTAKSDTPKSYKSQGSNASNQSSKLRAVLGVIKAVAVFQRVLRKSNHAHRGRYECQYCFEDLDKGPVAFLMGTKNVRCCKHLLHQECCAALQERAQQSGVSCNARCPCCSKAFASFVSLPDPVEETEAWFSALDYSNCQKICKDDAMDHLMSVLPVKTGLRESLQPAPLKINFRSCEALIERLDRQCSKAKRRAPPHVPDIQNHHEWFSFWDIYEEGALSRLGATRAICKTFQKFDKFLLRAAVDAVWAEVVAAGDGDEPGSIGKDQIFQPNTGLVDNVSRKVQAAQHWKLLRELNPC